MTRLVFVHGLGDDSSAWDVMLAQPALQMQDCAAIDVPGFGGRSYDGQRLEELAAQLWDEVSGDEPVAVVGHSMGGAIATLIAEQHPEGLAGIVSMEGNLTEHDTFFSSRIAGTKDFGAWYKRFRSRWPGRYGLALDKCEPSALQSCAADLVRLSADNAIGQRYKSSKVPRLFVQGTRDMPAETSEFLAGEAVATLEAGHWVMEDQPVAAAAHIGYWATQLS